MLRPSSSSTRRLISRSHSLRPPSRPRPSSPSDGSVPCKANPTSPPRTSNKPPRSSRPFPPPPPPLALRPTVRRTWGAVSRPGPDWRRSVRRRRDTLRKPREAAVSQRGTISQRPQLGRALQRWPRTRMRARPSSAAACRVQCSAAACSCSRATWMLPSRAVRPDLRPVARRLSGRVPRASNDPGGQRPCRPSPIRPRYRGFYRS